MSAEARPAGVPNNRAARTVYVMRSTGAGSEPGGGGSSGSPLNTDSGTHKRKVLLARKLPAGGTIHLTETPVSVTAPDGYDEELKTVPQSMMSPARMPRANVATGETVERSVLGSAPEYDALMASKRAGLDTSADFEEELSAAEGDSLLEDYRLKQDQAREAEAELRQRKDEQRQARTFGAKPKSLIHEQMAKGKETRALAKWDRQVRDWERFKVRMTRQLGKTVDELVFSRAEEWREMIEDFELLSKAVPPEEAQDPDQWEMSLRNAWTKYVSIGNSLSGLYLPIAMRSDDDMSNFTRIQRPEGSRMRATMSAQKAAAGKTFMVSTKTWREAPSYAKKRQKFRKNLEKLWPHEPLFAELEVNGYKPGAAGSTADSLASQPTAGVTGESVPVSDEPIADPVPERPNNVPVGPDLHFESRRVLLECTCGKIASSTVSARNNGSTALYYTWRKLEKPNVLGKKKDGVTRLWFAAKGGSVLPGRSVTFDFSFKSDTPGAWTEEWELTTQPVLPGGAIRVSAKGIALSRVENAVQRDALETKLAASIKMSTVSMMLGDLVPELDLERNQTPAVIKQVTDPEAFARERALAQSGASDVTEELFNAQNRKLNLFFSPDLFPSFAALAQQVFELLKFPQADREWDLSVDSLFQLMKRIEPEHKQQKCLDTLAALVKIATIPPTDSSLPYAIGHTLLGDMVVSAEGWGNKAKADLQELGQYPADPPPPEDGEEPAPAPEPSDADKAQMEAFVGKMEAEVKDLLGAAIDSFERLSIAGEVESRMRALQHFGLLPGPENEDDDDDDETASNISGFSGRVPPLGSAADLEQYSMMSALNQSANMTGSQLYSSLVDGGGHTPHEEA